MIAGKQYIEIVSKYFDFLITDFNLELYDEKIRGNAFYDVQYRDQQKVISVSYENIADHLLVIVFVLQNDELPDYDDKTRTLHLTQLNTKVLAHVDKEEISKNGEHFLRFKPASELERKLLKSAKELRLCLKHIVI